MQADSDINLRDFLELLWQKKFLIVTTTLIISVCSLVYIINEDNIYQSSAKLFNKSDVETSSIGSALGGISGFLDVGNGSGSSTEYAISKLQSRDFFKIIIQDENILKNIYAAKEYNSEDDKLIYDSTKLEHIKKNIYFEKAFENFRKNIFEINKNRSSGLITIRVNHLSPVFARDLLELIIYQINLIISIEDEKESSNSLIFLENMYDDYSNITTRESIIKLTEKNLEKKVLSQVNKENYIFKVVENPFIPEERIYPARTQFMIMSIIISFIFSIIISLALIFVKKQKGQ
tara:strand:- start:674 stop:1546 length:873 start_codon:yes stop_codon:yes gene_type:complete